MWGDGGVLAEALGDGVHLAHERGRHDGLAQQQGVRRVAARAARVPRKVHRRALAARVVPAQHCCRTAVHQRPPAQLRRALQARDEPLQPLQRRPRTVPRILPARLLH